MSHRSTTGCGPEHAMSQVEFTTGQPTQGSPATEFRRPPTRSFVRKFFNRTLRFPDGLEAEVWSFEDETSGRGLPAPTIRAREGDIVHVTLHPSKSAHTLHFHGIEPDPRNDGVGHSSFEVTGSYTYQFRLQPGEAGNPNRGSAGSYFYHCHVNTVLHVQMGMFGPMVFDPATGRGRAFVDDPVGYDTRAETFLAAYALDPRWHRLSHAAGLGGEDVGLERFEPSHFYLLGGNLDAAPTAAGVKSVGEILATADPARPGILRTLNGSYFPLMARFGGGLMAEVYSHDGRPLRDTSVRPSPPVSALTDRLAFGAAERYEMRLRPPSGARSGDTFPADFTWHHWITRDVVGAQRTLVRVL